MSEASRAYLHKWLNELWAGVQQRDEQRAKVRQAQLENQPGYKAMVADPEYVRLMAEGNKVIEHYEKLRSKLSGNPSIGLTAQEQEERRDLKMSEDRELQPILFKLNELMKDYGLAAPVYLWTPTPTPPPTLGADNPPGEIGTGGASKPAVQPTGNDDDEAMLSAPKLAERYCVSAENLRKRLDRWRYQHDDGGWTQAQDRKVRGPKYLYRLGSVRGLMKAMEASAKRPSVK